MTTDRRQVRQTQHCSIIATVLSAKKLRQTDRSHRTRERPMKTIPVDTIVKQNYYESKVEVELKFEFFAFELLPRLLSEVKNEVAYPLYLLFRRSLNESSIPTEWKRANVCPIFKKESRNLAENYRPVSLTSQVCKVSETLIRDTLVKHLEGNKLINDSQHGFRAGRSCLTNLLTFLDRVTGCIDTRR